jgi:molecular chaperone GrpE
LKQGWGENTMTEPNHATEANASATKDARNAPDEVAALKARAEAAEKARDEYTALAQRTQADFENYQKRQARELAIERRFAQTPLALDLLPALDNLERAINAAQQAGDKGALAQGVAMVQSQLLDALRRHGVTRIDAQGKPFDPNLHQAVMQQPSKAVPPSTVVQVLEQGFLIYDRVLRPARVVVSVAPAEDARPAS